MSSFNVSYLISQFAYQIPAVLVYVVALVLAVVYLKRCLIPSIMTLVAVGILLSTMVVFTVIQVHLIQSQQYRLSSYLGFFATLTRAVGNMLLVAAIFVGRGNPIAGTKV